LEQYLFCGQTVVSNIAIPELLSVNYDNGDISFSVSSVQRQLKDSFWTRYWLSPEGEKMIFYHKKYHFHWLRFPGLADFRISENAKEISCYPLSELPAETTRHLLLDQVLPRCLAHQGKIMLHASAVTFEQGLILFIGESGAGKSTLAGNFHRAGNPAVSDDCIWVKEYKDQIIAVPSYVGLRLWEDSLQVLFSSNHNTHLIAHYSTKKRVAFNKTDILKFRKGCPVLSVIVLDPPSQTSNPGIRLDPISFREAFIEIANESFQLDSFDRNERSSHMQTLALIATKVPTFRLSMPRDYELLPVVRQKILEIVL
jgi:hypothetical protein